jgi:hypothetical protein
MLRDSRRRQEERRRHGGALRCELQEALLLRHE